MSLSDIPRSVQLESMPADPETVYEPGALVGAKWAISYCSTVGYDLGDYERLRKRLDRGLVLTKKDRRQLQDILNQYWTEWDRMEPEEERPLVAWARREVWDAHRPPEEHR